jgi:hypothetical protein
VGFGVGEEAQLFVHDCDVTAVSIGGALGFGKARLVARNLTVTGWRASASAGRTPPTWMS